MILWLLLQCLRQQSDVALELVDAVGARGMVLVPDAQKLLDAAGYVEILMRHAVVAGAAVSPGKTRIEIAESGVRPLDQPIARCLQAAAEACVLDDQLHIGIRQEQIVVGQFRSGRAVEGRIPGLLEIVEGKAVQLPGQPAPGEERGDEFLRSVGRAGIADHPASDVIGNGTETALEIGHLVFDDHVAAQQLAARHITVRKRNGYGY